MCICLAIIEKLLGELSKINGLRPAKAGEFTKQPFEWKMNILQVEGSSNPIQAKTEVKGAMLKHIFRQQSTITQYGWLDASKKH